MKLVNAVFSKQNGGLEQASLDYARALKGQGHEVTLMLGTRCPFTAEAQATGCAIYMQKNRFGHGDVLAMGQLRRWLKREKPDAVLAHGNRAISLLRHAARGLVPVIAVNHTTSVRRSVGADAVIVVNDALKHAILRLGHTDGQSVYVVPNMVEIRPEHRALPAFSGFRTPPVIGTLARFSPEKGLHELLDAAAILYQEGVVFTLKIGGDGTLRAELEEKIRLSGLEQRVQLCGWVRDRDAFYAGLDIYCLPSRAETFGIVVLEAMQRKRPVVATHCDGVRQLVAGRDDVALLVPPADATALADGLRSLLADPARAAQLSSAGYGLVAEKYDIQIVAMRLQSIITHVVQAYANQQGAAA